MVQLIPKKNKTRKRTHAWALFCVSDFLFHIWLRFTASSKTDVTVIMSSVRDVCGSVLSRAGCTRNPEDRKVLCVGLTCLDSIHVVKTFPAEDTDVRWVLKVLSTQAKL
jgi:hypothetical protein